MKNLEEYLTIIIHDAVKTAVDEAFLGIEDHIRIATTPPFLTKNKVMKITGWSGRTLQHMRDSRQIDFVKHGRKILYPTQSLYDFLDTHRVKRRLG